jgi:uncharacterized tellurite resistance protein B-like protein/GTP-binding protein EngB required for normal cell division
MEVRESSEYSETLNYSFLLLVHIICADQQIHSRESRALRDLAQQTHINELTLQEMERVLGQDATHISFEECARSVPVGQRSEVLRQILAIAYIDGYFSPLEREVVDQIAAIWGIHGSEIQQMLEVAQGFDQRNSDTDNDEDSLSIGAKLLKGAESVLSRSLIAKLAELAPENIGQRIERLQREILLAGPEYDEAIKKCASTAQEDYKYAHRSLESSYNALKTLAGRLQESIYTIKRTTTGQGQYKAAKEVSEKLEQTRRNLLGEILRDLENMREAIRAKKRALNHFSIAFLGKTKAGKSTLHAVVTGEGWESIGIGKQRTTRYNRVYEWKNIRIIDTPGIGAPGGKTDEEIAQSIIEEADVICYVVTDDSIQETEFEFLKVLKGKTKPLIILLNIQYNLRDSRRLEHFLKDPDRWFALDGKNGIGGHLNRIQRYAKQHYANDYMSIVPVMLLAAQLSREPKHQQQSQRLFKASRIQDFLDSIRESIIDYGAIRRSQTLLGSTVGAIDTPCQWITGQASIYSALAAQLQEKSKSFNHQVQRAQQDHQKNLQQQIREIFQTAFNQVTPFAEEHWAAKEAHMNQAWSNLLKKNKFEERIQASVEQACHAFQKDTQEALEEIGNELEILARLQSGSFKFTEQDSNFFDKDFIRMTSTIMLALGVLGVFLFPPLGFISLAGTAIGIIANFFKSKDEKRREAVSNITSALQEQLNEHQAKVLQESRKIFENYCQSLNKTIEVYFEELIQGIQAIASKLEAAQNELNSSANYLNRAYAKRIIDWATDRTEELTDTTISKTIRKVDREFGKSLNIRTTTAISLRKSPDEICTVLQERVTFHPTKH